MNTNNNFSFRNKAFTLLEMLIVIAIIAIIAGIVIIAINPGRQLAQARNAERASALNALDKAIKQYYIDNFSWPPESGIPEEWTEICETGGGSPDDCIELEEFLVPNYLSALPQNPGGTNFMLALNGDRLSLYAPGSDEFGLPRVFIGQAPASEDGNNDGGQGDVPGGGGNDSAND